MEAPLFAELHAFLDRARAEAAIRLAAAKIDLGAQGVNVCGTFSADGRFSGVQVAGTTGSEDTDLHVEQALDQMHLDDAPPILAGVTITLSLR